MIMEVFFISAAVFMYAYERLKSERSWPEVNGWFLRAVAFTGVQALIVVNAGVLWDDWLASKKVWDISVLGGFFGTLVAFLILTFFSYWQHRIKHIFPFFWRWLHQVHHSPERLELLTSFYRNPIEIVANMFVISSVLFILVGASPEIAGDVILLLGLTDMFYHWNIKTPKWLGYIVQRPEAHCIHHRTGVHAYNYGDLAIWDILFGTFKNPESYSGKCGFKTGAEENILEMVLGKDQSDGEHIYGKKSKQRVAR